MKTAYLIVQLTLVACLCAAAEKLSDKVADGEPRKTLHLLIDPNKSILGFKVGTAEDDVVKKLGKPVGYVRLDEENTAAIFENTHAYIFTDGRLSGIRISHSLIDHNLMEQFNGKRFLPAVRWKLANGIQPETSLGEARQILGDKLQPADEFSSKYHQHYEDGECVIHLYFSHHVDQGDEDSAYRLIGILLKPKS